MHHLFIGYSIFRALISIIRMKTAIVTNAPCTTPRRTGTRCTAAATAHYNNYIKRKCIIIITQSTRSSAIAEGPRDASCQLKSCQLPRNSVETSYTTSPDQIDGMKLEIQSEAMRDRLCALNHDAIESAPIVSGVINKPTTVELCISPVYRQLAVAKFSKSTMQKLLT